MARKMAQRQNGREAGPFAGLTFAVYARVSREDDRAEEHTSPARQVSQATVYVDERGGRVDPAHVYSDEGVSGAEFRNRQGLLRLLAALDGGRPPFNALVMSEESRLGREQVETAYILKRILDAGVRVFYYMADQERRLDSAQDKIMASLALFGAEVEREKARQRARDKALAQVRAGHVAGGEPYGYENVRWKDGREVPRGQLHDYVTRRVKADEAEVIRAVFRMYAAEWGTTAIAKTMNGVPAYADQLREFFGGRPPAPPRQRTGSWAPAAVREILYRRAYHGERVWGRTGKAERNGQAGRAARRPEREWRVFPAPELKIVPDDLWEAVQKRLKMVNEDYLRDTRGKLWGKPDRGKEGGYLLSGLAKCGCCGWNLAVLGRERRVYGCSHHHRRGVCGNGLAQAVPLVDGAFLGVLEAEVLTAEGFRYALACGLERAREQMAREPDRAAILERERAGLVRRIERMVAAIGDGRGPAPPLVQEIERAWERVRAIEAEIARLAAVPAVGDLDLERVGRAVEARLGRFGDLLRGNVSRARQALKKLLVDRVEFTPVARGNGRPTYTFKGELSYGAVLRESLDIRERSPWGHHLTTPWSARGAPSPSMIRRCSGLAPFSSPSSSTDPSSSGRIPAAP